MPCCVSLCDVTLSQHFLYNCTCSFRTIAAGNYPLHTLFPNGVQELIICCCEMNLKDSFGSRVELFEFYLIFIRDEVVNKCLRNLPATHEKRTAPHVSSVALWDLCVFLDRSCVLLRLQLIFPVFPCK